MTEGGVTQNTGKEGGSVMGKGQETLLEWCKRMQFREGNAESTNQRLTIHHPLKIRISGAGPVRSGLSRLDIPKLLHGPNTEAAPRPRPCGGDDGGGFVPHALTASRRRRLGDRAAASNNHRRHFS